MDFLVSCEQCGLVCISTAMNYARKNATDHYDEVHNGTREVKIWQGTLLDTLYGQFSGNKK